jgi:hypothetical protein
MSPSSEVPKASLSWMLLPSSVKRPKLPEVCIHRVRWDVRLLRRWYLVIVEVGILKRAGAQIKFGLEM